MKQIFHEIIPDENKDAADYPAATASKNAILDNPHITGL
jgi:hypothetical protein